MRLEKRGMVHSRIILGSFLLYLKELLGRSLEEPIEKIITSLTPFSKEMIDNATLSIMETTEEIFWEVCFKTKGNIILLLMLTKI